MGSVVGELFGGQAVCERVPEVKVVATVGTLSETGAFRQIRVVQGKGFGLSGKP